MISKANSSLTETLIRKPETGMGYQLIKARCPNEYATQKYIVFNAELIVNLDESFQESMRSISNEGFVRMFNKVDFLDLNLISVLKRQELRSFRLLFESKLNYKKGSSEGRGAVDNDSVYANGEDIFVRISAYENDRRINFKKRCLLNGTYTTSKEDYLSCKQSNDDPIDRYALPNAEEIKWAFHIQPTRFDNYRLGIVQPANGCNGGGIEALFDNGTTNNTYLKKTTY